MTYSNPLNALLKLGTPAMQKNQPIDPNRFRQAVSQMSTDDLSNFVNQARRSGISEADIEAGLNAILSMR